jgi:hypothetical protein
MFIGSDCCGNDHSAAGGLGGKKQGVGGGFGRACGGGVTGVIIWVEKAGTGRYSGISTIGSESCTSGEGGMGVPFQLQRANFEYASCTSSGGGGGLGVGTL